MELPFARHIGLQFVSASADRVPARMLVTPEICKFPAILHGGAIIALAGTFGVAAKVLNLPKGAWTTTIESKTNFVASAPLGTTVLGEVAPVHGGRRMMSWQTRVSTEDGKLVALAAQTQLVFEKL